MDPHSSALLIVTERFHALSPVGEVGYIPYQIPGLEDIFPQGIGKPPPFTLYKQFEASPSSGLLALISYHIADIPNSRYSIPVTELRRIPEIINLATNPLIIGRDIPKVKRRATEPKPIRP
jgi:hypothetical protein